MSLERETKLLVPVHRAPPVLAVLRAFLRPDGDHPGNTVASLYYESRSLRSLGEKLGSLHLKTKLRLRWYEHERTGAPEAGPAFLEVKRRTGSAREKERVPVPIDVPIEGARLSALGLDHPAISGLPAWGRAQGLDVEQDLVPALLIRYHRLRFVDPWTGSRLSLDTRIRTSRTARRFSRGASARLPLPLAVVEVKGAGGPMPLLAPLLALGARLGSFSKYGACLAAECPR